MDYIKEKKNILGVPLIEYKIDGQNPTIFFIHGIKRNKEYVEKHVLRFVNEGFNVISIDAYMHGERKNDIGDLDLELKYPDVVIKTGEEIKKLKDYYTSKTFVDENNLFVMGISMGGAIAIYTSMIMDIRGFISIIGSPSIVSFLEYCSSLIGIEFSNEEKRRLSLYDPLLNYKKLQGKNILLVNGTMDHRVPDKYSKELLNKLDSVDLKLYETDHTVKDEMLEDIYKWIEDIIL